MGQDRLNSVALIKIERCHTNKIIENRIDSVIDTFAKRKHRHRKHRHKDCNGLQLKHLELRIFMQQSYCIAFLHCIKVYYFVNTTFHFIK